MKEINVIYTSSNDPDFEKHASVVKVITPNIVLSYAEVGEWAFRVLNEAISEQRQSLEIDLDKCGHAIISLQGDGEEEITAEFLAKASFIEVIEALANKKPGDAGTSTSR